MKNKSFFVALAFFISVVVCATPFALWQFVWGEPIYDSVFEESASSLPVLKAGRIMPLSSASADALKAIGGKSSAKLDGKKMSSVKCFILLNANPRGMSYRPLLRTDNKQLQKLFNTQTRYYSYDEIANNYETLYKAATAPDKSAYSEAATAAINAGIAYKMSSDSLAFRLDGNVNASESLSDWRKSVAEAAAEIELSKKENRKSDDAKLRVANAHLGKIKASVDMSGAYSNTALRAIADDKTFLTSAEAMFVRSPSKITQTICADYAKFCDAIASDNTGAAREILRELHSHLREVKNIDFIKLKVENIVNAIDPFFCGFALYGLCCACFLLSFVFVKVAPQMRCMGAFFLLAGAVIHIAAIGARMYIQDRPPVTNLYSSIVFTGAVAAMLGYLIYAKKGMLTFALAGATAGLFSLLLAMNLPYGGDTMGMMRAVLNSNFWLTTHVVTIMIGYCGVFLAGFVAEFRLIANIFERNTLVEATRKSADSVYGILCFALLFSFAGTMLGGIWADMSWGRFWGWDPKENGALMIVLWCAAAIHGRVMKRFGDRTFLAFAVFGNVIAAWAWFGVNLMGVGLHAYGFIDGGWTWFFAFVATQLLVLPLALIKQK